MTNKISFTIHHSPSTIQLYATVALPIPVNSLFTYKIPPEMESSAETGRRALVPFGKRLLTGFIVGLQDNPGTVPISKIKPIQDIIDSEPVFDSHMLELSKWIADYYLSTTGEVLKAAMPTGTMIQSRVLVSLISPPDETEITLTELQRKIVDALREGKPLTLKKLERSLQFKAAGIVRSLEKKGLVRIEYDINTPDVRIKTERYVKPALNATACPPSRAKKQVQCLDIIRAHPDGIPLSELLERHSISRGVVNALTDMGLAYYEDVEISRRSAILDQEHIKADHQLTEEQKASFDLIMKEAKAEAPRTVLLKGVTGSGKTRVYIELVKEALKAGKGALILVPEISLTPQTTRFFSSVFPDRVAVMHSAMSTGERYDAWRHIHDGTYDVVIGPRSAVFAPLPNPGIIIVDEEHDPSYKQTDNAPRYHARDVAVVRGHMLGIPVVLGSATPSLESWQNASTGKYILSLLTERVDARPLPEVVMVDVRNEWAAGNQSSLSGRLRDELAIRNERGEKSIILINRRGYASVIRCKECGHVLTCPDCTIALTYHSSKGLALCHMCGHKQLILEHCPDCGSSELIYKGTGTQRIEKELAIIAGKDAIVRMDSDTTGAHDAHFRLLEEFRNGPTKILLGTQMVAKGHDIPEVTLVGVISADLSLYIPDFRAGERTFQLITQVAGRAGRGDIPGTVVMQTLNPDNYAVAAAAQQNFEAFAEQELEQRKELDFPPFSRLILIELSSEDLSPLEKLADDIAQYLKEQVPEGTEVMGPVDAPLARIKGRYRIHILLKSQDVYRLRSLVRHVMENVPKGKETIGIDVDPVDIV